MKGEEMVTARSRYITRDALLFALSGCWRNDRRTWEGELCSELGSLCLMNAHSKKVLSFLARNHSHVGPVQSHRMERYQELLGESM